MDVRTLAWGILGTARINRALIPPIRASARNRLAAVASRTPERADLYAREWGIERSYGSYEALLADPEIDVVFVPLPNALHAPWAIRAVEAGKHVLCEKPLATSVEDVRAIEAAARTHRRIVAEAFMYRHHPLTSAVAAAARSGAIGELRLIRGWFSFVLDRPQDARWDPAMGGGSLWDVGCYPLSYARAVTGAEPVEVVGSRQSSPSGVDEVFTGLLRFPGRVQAVIDCSFTTPFQTGMELIGTAGRIVVRNPFKPGTESGYDLVTASGCDFVPVAGQELYSGEVEDLASAVLDGSLPRVTLADSRANVAAIEALYESARIGRPVRPPVE